MKFRSFLIIFLLSLVIPDVNSSQDHGTHFIALFPISPIYFSDYINYDIILWNHITYSTEICSIFQWPRMYLIYLAMVSCQKKNKNKKLPLHKPSN